MKHLTAHCTVSGWLVVCLLLAFACPAQAQCPPYPKQMDEVYACIDLPKGLVFDARASLHNPIRFHFGTWASDESVLVDFKDGNGFQTIVSGETRIITYLSSAERTQVGLDWVAAYRVPSPNGDYFVFKNGIHTFQLNFNPSAPYSSFAANTEVWDDPGMVGQTYTPPVSGAYPPGSPYNPHQPL